MDTKMIDIISPLTNEVIGQVKAMSKKEVGAIIQKAKESWPAWRELASSKRMEYLYNAADLLEERADELAEIVMLEVGKDKKSARTEVMRTADMIRFTVDIAQGLNGTMIPAENFPGGSKNKYAITNREPLGVVLAISPFNYPVNLAASKIAPALVTGNTVVFKPATQGSLSGTFLANVFLEAGIPEGVLAVITGKGSEIGDYVVVHKDIDFVNFTGSTEVGQHIAQQVRMIPILMELGGKDAAVVLEDADLDLAAKHIVAGAFSYSGQRCTAIKRVLVVNEVADALVDKIRIHVMELKVGNPADTEGGLDVVPLINEKAADFVEELIIDAKEKGANILCGGTREGNMVQPTLIDHVTTDMRVAWEEPFGPVLPVLRVTSMEEAIQIANESEYGLQSSVFTKDVDKAFEVARKLEVGTVQINNKTERGPDNLPFLGVKSSGIGVQGIMYSIEAMTRVKSTVLNLS